MKVNNEFPKIPNILDGRPQGSVPGRVLSTILTYNLLTRDYVTIAAYPDDTAFLCPSESASEAFRCIQQQLNHYHQW